MAVQEWLAGPVAITGANGQVGTELQQRLAELPNEVRPLGRRDDLYTAFMGADTVIHLAGTLQPRRPKTYLAANLDTVAATVRALRRSAVKRVVFLSYVDADPASVNLYLRYKGAAEGLIGAAGTPAVILRATHIVGTPQTPGPTAASMQSRTGKPVSVLGSGDQRYAWLARNDVVDALVRAALDPTTPTGTFELAGPEALTVDDFVRYISGPRVRIRHLPAAAARLLARVLPALPEPLVDVMLRDSVPRRNPQETALRLGVTLHPLSAVWPRP